MQSPSGRPVDEAKAQWLRVEMGWSVDCDETPPPPAEVMPAAFPAVPSAFMDKMTIVAPHGCDPASSAAAKIRALRMLYVEDLRLWLQLQSRHLQKKWLEGKGLGGRGVDTPYVALNGVPLGGVEDLVAHLPHWRGEKLARDIGCPALFFRHFPCESLSASSAIVADRSSGFAFVVDPRIDTSHYIEVLRTEGLRLRGVLLTHTAWDFVTGHALLQKEFNCPVYLGPQPDRVHGLERNFTPTVVDDGMKLEVGGSVEIQCLLTPGPTWDSVSYVVVVGGKPVAVFSGDTLLADTVGRVDVESHLAPRDPECAQDAMSRRLYTSVRRLIELDEQCVVFPAHFGLHFAAHSVEPRCCSRLRAMVRGGNPVLNLIEGKHRCAKDAGPAALEGHLSKLPAISFPSSFHSIARMNALGVCKPPLETIPACPITTLLHHIPQWSEEAARRAFAHHLHPSDPSPPSAPTCPLLLDLRPQAEYCERHIRGSLSIPLLPGLRFEAFASALVERHDQLRIALIVHDQSVLPEAAIRLARVGLSDAVSFAFTLAGAPGLAPSVVGSLTRVVTREDTLAVQSGDTVVIDARAVIEHEAQGVAGCVHVPLEDLKKWAASPPGRDRLSRAAPHNPAILYCAGGYRSFIGATLLSGMGYPATDVPGGGLQLMCLRPDVWKLRNRMIKCTS